MKTNEQLQKELDKLNEKVAVINKQKRKIIVTLAVRKHRANKLSNSVVQE